MEVDTLFVFSLAFFLVIVCAKASPRCLHQSRAAYFSPSSPLSGACGYGSVASGFHGYYVAAGSSRIFRNGVGCGACFQIRCKNPSTCNGSGIKVVLTDLNNRNNQTDFLISGQAFTAMARSGMANELKKLDSVDVEYKRIPCQYKNKNLSIRVEEKSKKPNHLTVKFLYQGGQTDIAAVDVAQVGSPNWEIMKRDYGPQWSSNRVPAGPLQFRMVVNSGYGGKWVFAEHVLPADWKAGFVYDLGVRIDDVDRQSC